jgi:hypothetical protein
MFYHEVNSETLNDNFNLWQQQKTLLISYIRYPPAASGRRMMMSGLIPVRPVSA